MGNLYEFECTKLKGVVVEARCRMIHPDAGDFPDKPSTGLMILWEAAKGRDPLIKELGGDLSAFMNRFLGGIGMGPRGDDASAYVKSVAISARKNFPPSRAFENSEKGAPVPTATYRIETTDPKWVKHLKVGKRWTSSAYD
jgi:hypothetical protein